MLDPSGSAKGVQIHQLPETCMICAGWTMPGQYICLVFWVLFGFIFIFILELYFKNYFTHPFEDVLPTHPSRKRNYTGTHTQYVTS